MKTVAETLGVARSSLVKRLAGAATARRTYAKSGDAALLARVRSLVDRRPSYGYRRITALVNRELASEGEPPANHKRIYRVMKAHGLLLTRHAGRRPGRLHDGKVVVIRSNLRWCSDALEFTCWNGEIVRVAFIIDAHDREIIAWRAVTGGRHQRLGRPRHDAGGGGDTVRFTADTAQGRVPDRQRLGLHGPGHPHLRRPARPRALLHARGQPGEQRHRARPSSGPSSVTTCA